MTMMKLSEWAAKHNIAYITAYRCLKAGIFPVHAYQTDSGTILVEDEEPTPQTDINNNDAMSLFLKKTVEYSKNSASVEDFAAYVISNFRLQLNSTLEVPRYSRQKPKSEDVQRHFQQFIPKGEKPKAGTFVMEPNSLAELQEVSKPVTPEELAQEFKEAILIPEPSSSHLSFTPISTTHLVDSVETTGAEGIVTRNVDLSTPQQQINYTGSNSSTFSSPLTSFDTIGSLNFSEGTLATSTLFENNSFSMGDAYATSGTVSNGLYFTQSNCVVPAADKRLSANLVGAFQPTQKELESTKTIEPQTFGPKRRGRKPTIKR